MEPLRQVLVQVMLFQFLRPGLTQDGATSNFSSDSKPLCQGFQMRYCLFLDSLEKMLKTVKMFSETPLVGDICPPVYGPKAMRDENCTLSTIEMRAL